MAPRSRPDPGDRSTGDEVGRDEVGREWTGQRPARGSSRRTGAAGRAIGRALTLWRRSVQARVVASVLVLSALVVGVVGWLLLRQITDGLVDNRVRASVAEASSEASLATSRLRQAGSGDFDPATQLRQLVENLVSRGRIRGFEVVVTGPLAEDSRDGGPAGSGLGTRTSPGIEADSVPDSLRDEVTRSPGRAWTFTTIDYLAEHRQDAAAVAVGNQIVLPTDGGTYAVYLIFPMTEEEQTVSLLQRSLITAGILLLLLLGGLTWLITRQVVTPIRMVRRVAERIASGRLEERMHVAGQDDIARLAVSFNQMTDTLQRQIRQLEELSRVQRQFVSDVSHELRTPLTTVRMAGDVLHDERSRFDPTTARAAELLQAELDRFENLLGDLLEISRFDAGAAVLDLSDVDLGEVALKVIEMTAPLAQQRGVRVRLLSPPDSGCIAEADVRRVERVVRNLITNAIDHAESRDVEVRVAADQDAAALSVRDHGVGLQPGQSAQVFNRFWRGDPARARTTGGTGLGLAIALEDARLHGGQLQAWGRPGEGALFRLTLPRRAGGPIPHSPLPLVPRMPEPSPSGRTGPARDGVVQ